jgi:hypothetical protein
MPKGVVAPFGRMHDDEVQVLADAQGRFTFRQLRHGIWHIRGPLGPRAEAAIDVATGTHDVQLVVPAPK